MEKKDKNSLLNIHYSRTLTSDNLSKAANYVGEYVLKGLGTLGRFLNAGFTSPTYGTTGQVSYARNAEDAKRLRELSEASEQAMGKAMTWVSPLNYGAAVWNGHGLDARKGEEEVASWSPAWLAVGRLGELYVGPKAVKGIKSAPKAVVNTAAKVGVKPAKAAVVAKEIKLGIKLNTKNGRIEVTDAYFNSPDKWYRVSETPEKFGIREQGRNITTTDSPQTKGTVDRFRRKIIKKYKTEDGQNFRLVPGKGINEGYFVRLPVRFSLSKNGSAHGNTSQAAAGQIWQGNFAQSGRFPEGIIEGLAPSKIYRGMLPDGTDSRTNFILLDWENVPKGARVGFHTGEMPMSNLGWFQKTNRGTYTYEPIIPEKRITKVGDVEIDNPQLAYRQVGEGAIKNFLKTGELFVPVKLTGNKLRDALNNMMGGTPMYKQGSLWYGLDPINYPELFTTAEPLAIGNKHASIVKLWIDPGKVTKKGIRTGEVDYAGKANLLGGRRVPFNEDLLNLSNVTSYKWVPGYGYRKVTQEPSTSLKFFERKPSKISGSERAGATKWERNFKPKWHVANYPGYLLKGLMKGSLLEKQLSKNGTININLLNAYFNKASQLEREVANKVLAEKFAGLKTIDYNLFKKTVLNELISYSTKPQMQYSTYGMNRLGFNVIKESDGVGGILEYLPGVRTNTFTFESPKIPVGNSKHYDPTTLGHSRTYTTSEEPRVLHVMESLSDWAQNFKHNHGVESMNDALPHPLFGDINSTTYVSPLHQYLANNYLQRQLQENLKYAAENGLTKMRYPTSETAAKIEGYSKTEQTPEFRKALAELERLQYLKTTNQMSRAERALGITLAINNNRLISIPDEINIGTGEIKYYTPKEKAKLIRDAENKLADILILLRDFTYSPLHQTILKKYADFPKLFLKLFKDLQVRTVTDAKGNTWYEVDVPKGYLSREWQFKQGGKMNVVEQFKQGGAIRKMQTAAGGPIINGGTPFSITVKGKDRRPAWKRMYQNPNLGDTSEYYNGNILEDVIGLTPGIGDAIDAVKVADAVNNKDYTTAGFLGAGLLLPNIIEKPFKFAKGLYKGYKANKTIKAARKAFDESGEKLEVDAFKSGSKPMYVTPAKGPGSNHINVISDELKDSKYLDLERPFGKDETLTLRYYINEDKLKQTIGAYKDLYKDRLGLHTNDVDKIYNHIISNPKLLDLNVNPGTTGLLDIIGVSLGYGPKDAILFKIGYNGLNMGEKVSKDAIESMKVFGYDRTLPGIYNILKKNIERGTLGVKSSDINGGHIGFGYIKNRLGGMLQLLKNGSGIHIKEKNKGKFTSYCGGKVTDECILKGKNSSNPAIRKRATFAANARKWKHLDGGIIIAEKGIKAGLKAKQNLTKRKAPDWDNLDRGYRYLTQDMKLPHDLAIAIMGNIVEESQGNYKAVLKNGGGRGLIQWDSQSAPTGRYGLWGKIWASVAKPANVYDSKTDTMKNYWAPWGGLKGEQVRLKFINAPLKTKTKIYAESYLRPGKPRIKDRQLSAMLLDSIYNPRIKNIIIDKEGGIIKAEDGTKFNWQSALTNVGTNLFNSYLQSRVQNNKINSEAEAAKAENEVDLNQYFWDIYLQELAKALLEEELKNKAISAMNDTVINSSPLVTLKIAYDKASQNYVALKANLEARNKAIDAQAEAAKSSVITDAVSGVIQNGLGMLKDYYGSKNNNTSTSSSITSNSYFDNYVNTKYKKFGTFNPDGSMNMLGGTFTIKDGYKPNQPQLFNYQPPKLNV